MATFNDMVVTRDGKIQYSKAMAGKKIQFTKVVFGSGNPASQAAAVELKGLVRAEIEGSIESVDTTTTEGVAIITASVNNATLSDELYIKEIGVFCKDPDTNATVMYSYCYSPNDIDVIPSSLSGAVIWKMRIQLAITNVESTTEPTEQSDFIDFTPVLTPTATDETVYISEVVANGKYIVKHGSVTAYYSITGKLTNMELALSRLTLLKISLPLASTGGVSFHAPMRVVINDGSAILVDALGTIPSNSNAINVNYIGTQNGNFSLNFSVQYYS